MYLSHALSLVLLMFLFLSLSLSLSLSYCASISTLLFSNGDCLKYWCYSSKPLSYKYYISMAVFALTWSGVPSTPSAVRCVRYTICPECTVAVFSLEIDRFCIPLSMLAEFRSLYHSRVACITMGTSNWSFCTILQYPWLQWNVEVFCCDVVFLPFGHQM